MEERTGHNIVSYYQYIIEGNLEVKLPTIWTDEKQSRAEAERRLEERRSEEKESGRKKMQMREKVGRSRNTVFFQ
jgi:RNase H-fold protein (predicted Holliday junction resolvase)